MYAGREPPARETGRPLWSVPRDPREERAPPVEARTLGIDCFLLRFVRVVGFILKGSGSPRWTGRGRRCLFVLVADLCYSRFVDVVGGVNWLRWVIVGDVKT